jgi:hypothetical protein
MTVAQGSKRDQRVWSSKCSDLCYTSTFGVGMKVECSLSMISFPHLWAISSLPCYDSFVLISSDFLTLCHTLQIRTVSHRNVQFHQNATVRAFLNYYIHTVRRWIIMSLIVTYYFYPNNFWWNQTWQKTSCAYIFGRSRIQFSARRPTSLLSFFVVFLNPSSQIQR